MMNIVFPIIKISLYQADNLDIVFIFTGVKTPIGDYIQIQISCPKGEGKKWIYHTFGLTDISYEVVLEGFEVAAPC